MTLVEVVEEIAHLMKNTTLVANVNSHQLFTKWTNISTKCQICSLFSKINKDRKTQKLCTLVKDTQLGLMICFALEERTEKQGSQYVWLNTYFNSQISEYLANRFIMFNMLLKQLPAVLFLVKHYPITYILRLAPTNIRTKR